MDIETVPLFSSLEDLKESPLYPIRQDRYCSDVTGEEEQRNKYKEKSSLFAEFSKICCISIAVEV